MKLSLFTFFDAFENSQNFLRNCIVNRFVYIFDVCSFDGIFYVKS